MKKADKPVFLIGFMGSGKSAVGRILAKRLGRRLIDTDREIVRAVGRSIASIFKDEGETGFRAREVKAVARACRQRGAVVAVGGGAVMRRENVAAMRRSGIVLYLQAPLPVVKRRVGKGAARPLWGKAGALFQRRVPLYNRAAHVRLRAGLGTAEAVAARAARRIS